MTITFRHLKQIKAIKEQGSFAGAARRLHISQPALSRSISSLEKQLQVKLFDRTKHEVLPTIFGEHLLQRGNKILQEVQIMKQDLSLLQGLETGNLAVGSGPLPAEVSLGTAVAYFIQNHPKVNVKIVVDHTPRLLEMLQNRDLDLFVADTRMLMDVEGLTIFQLPQQHALFFCRKDHPLTRKNKPTVKDILSYPLAMMWLPEPVLNSLISDADVSFSDIRDLPYGILQCDYLKVLWDILAASDSVGIGTQAVLARSIHSAEVVSLPIEIPELNSHYGVVSLSRYSRSGVAEMFQHYMVKADRELCGHHYK